MIDLALFSDFQFLRPLWLLALIPIGFLTWSMRKALSPAARWRPLISDHILKHILVPGRSRRWFNPASVNLFGALVAVIALSGPGWQRQPTPFEEDQSALIIILDVSSSMKSRDVQPTRLERAKLKITDLLQLRGLARSALVVYSGTAHVAVPLTNDPSLYDIFLGAIEPEIMPVEGKVPKNALDLAIKILDRTGVAGSVLLISDDASGLSDVAARVAGQQGLKHQILVLGIGSLKPPATGQYLPLDEPSLKQVARNGGGTYRRWTANDADIRQINRHVLSHYTASLGGVQPRIDMGYWLLYPIAIFLLLWFRKGWTLQWAIVGVIGIGLMSPPAAQAKGLRFADLWMTPDQQGQFHLKRKDYAVAAERFEDLEWRAFAHYLAQDFERAAELYGQIGTAEGFFNQANALAHAEHYLRARSAYGEALRLDPSFDKARRNRDLIQQIIDEINAMSAAQVPEQGERSVELGTDDPKRADGADKETFGPIEIEQVTAEELFADDALREMWLREVQTDPGLFLSAKFRIQLENRARPEQSGKEGLQ